MDSSKMPSLMNMSSEAMTKSSVQPSAESPAEASHVEASHVEVSQAAASQTTGRKRRRRRVVRPGKEQGGVSAEAWNDTDAAWGDQPQEPDEFYLREKPPHWQP